MVRSLQFSGIDGSYDGETFYVEIIEIVAPFTPYVETSEHCDLMTVTLPDDCPVTLDAQIAQLASVHAYNNTLLKERNRQEWERRRGRHIEQLGTIRHALDNLKSAQNRIAGDTDTILEAMYSILKNMEI